MIIISKVVSLHAVVVMVFVYFKVIQIAFGHAVYRMSWNQNSELMKNSILIMSINFVFQQRKAPASYKSAGQLPREREVKELKIYVDKKYETIILPIWGIPVPFHICTIKNISTSVEGE